MECELCGSREVSCKAEIEGVVLSVCEKCAKYGREILEEKKEVKRKKLPITKPTEIEKVPVEDFSIRVKKLREEKKLSQEELAAKIKEKVSVIKRIEEGWIPEEKVIEKLERFFGVKLREEIPLESVPRKPQKEEKLTIGDVVEIK